MPDMEKIIKIVDELIFEAQKEQTWKTENALRCIKKELLKEQETVVRCKDCHFYLGNGFCNRSGIHLTVNDNWFCADGERRIDDV